MNHYSRILAAVAAQPWAIERLKGEAIADFLTRKARGETIDRADIQAAVDKNKGKAKPAHRNGIAMLRLHGTITQRADWLSEYSGGTSAEQVGRWVDEAAADASIEAIILDIDSPGGSCYGVAELADKVYAARKVKRVVAVCNSLCASAAYWIGSQASELVVTPSGEIGSIGVYLMHVDRSKELADAGQKVTLIKAGERKASGHPYAPLDETSLSELQGGVDDYYAAFVRAVARGRKTSATTVTNGFGRGGTVRADQAVREGMADRVGTLDSVLGSFGFRFNEDGSALVPSAVATRPSPVASQPYHPDREISRRRQLLANDEQADRAKAEVTRRRKLLARDDDTSPVARQVATAHPPLTQRDVFIAYHEAGHALAAVALGASSVRATILADGQWDGCVLYVPTGLTPHDRAVILCAGHAAEILAPGYDWRLAIGTDRNDRRDLETECPRELRPSAERAAANLMAVNRDRLNHLASALMEHRKLGDADIRAIVLGG